MILCPMLCEGTQKLDEFPEITCLWELDHEYEGFITSCGHWHDIDEGYPEQEIIYCPYCNSKIYVEDNNEDTMEE